jgi:hypothetical protein
MDLNRIDKIWEQENQRTSTGQPKSGSKKTKEPKQGRQNLGARNREPKYDRQNLGARKPKGLNRTAKIWEQENQRAST